MAERSFQSATNPFSFRCCYGFFVLVFVHVLVIQKNSDQKLSLTVLHRIFLFISREKEKRSEHNLGVLFCNPGHNQKRRNLCLLIMCLL